MELPIVAQFKWYKKLIEDSLDQVPDSALNEIPLEDGNSIAMIVRHLSGNLQSRFTDFLTSDGEKSWRNREQEFLEGPFERKHVVAGWQASWSILSEVLQSLTVDDLQREVSIRGIALTVEEALNRSLAHIAYHAGQIVLLARMYRSGEWKWLTIPKGKSDDYNADPYLEKPQ